mgnify:CR=1 FL=1
MSIPTFNTILCLLCPLLLMISSCDKANHHKKTPQKDQVSHKSETTYEIIPSVGIPLKDILNSPALDKYRKKSLELNKIIEDLNPSQLRFSCREVATNDGNRFALSPSPFITDNSGITYPNGRFIRLYQTFSGNGYASVNDETRHASNFHFVIDYNLNNRGILLIPFWIIIDQSEANNPKIIQWGLHEELISHIEQKMENP